MHPHDKIVQDQANLPKTESDAGIPARPFSIQRQYGIKPARMFSGIILLVSLMAALFIAVLQHDSDSIREQQILLQSLGQVSSQLSSVHWEITSKAQLEDETLQESIQFQKQAVRILARLKQEAGRRRNASLSAIEACLHDFIAGSQQQLSLLQQGQKQQARQKMMEQLDDNYDHLNTAIQEANQAYGQEAERINLIADWGTGAILLAAAFGIGILFHRFERSQQSAVALLSEQKALQKREEHFNSLIRNASDIISVWDPQGVIRYMSPAIERILGHGPTELAGRSAFDMIHPQDQTEAREFFFRVCNEAGSLSGEWRIHHSDDTWRYVEVIATNLIQDSSIAGILVTYRDVTARKTVEHQLAHQALHDNLTGLPNRSMLMQSLRVILSPSRRKTISTAVFFLDLDNFKIINDSLGHEAGDQLLITVATRLQQCVRPTDLVARLGGDEFTVLLDDLRSMEEATGIAERIVQALRAPVTLQNTELFVSCSLGIAYTSDPSTQPDILLRDADTAMYQAKTNGKSGYTLFEPSMNDRMMERVELESNLRIALHQNQFILHYQPLVDLDSGQLIGVEALVRWQHPTHGLISPGKFIPIAEETGIIVPLGYWVLEEACRQAKEWQNMYPNRTDFTVNVNLSGKQLQRADVVERIKAIVELTQIAPGNLKLEITESVMMADMEDSLAKLHQIKALGVKLAMDDFGTGYSSMANLSLFPIDTIKIDRAFISRLADQPQAASIIEAIVRLSKSLNLDVTGEGVETADQVLHLQSLGCNVGQGYFFDKPLPPAGMAERMATGPRGRIKPREAVEREIIEQMLRAA